jgi:UDP-N-acetylmuramyl tripeptide synthase
MTATPVIALTDSRRLLGPNLLWERPGAVLDVALPEERAEEAIAAWQEAARQVLAAVGWPNELSRVRRFHGGASLAISAPIDALLAATEVNEWALAAANAALGAPAAPPLAVAAAGLRDLIAHERRPALLALARAARRAGVTLLIDDETVSVGTGTGSMAWPITRIPSPAEIDWAAVHDVPTVLVTGANGKTTTVRLLSAVLTSAGRVAGMSCSDSVSVAGEVLDRGDWSGPGGARKVLRDRRVQVAVLETARGGILRRGLAVTRADAAIITNVAEDHFGEYGIQDLAGLTEAKFVVTRALGPSGRLVLNADDPSLVSRAMLATAPIVWLTLDPDNPVVQEHVEQGGEAGLVDGGEIVLIRERRSTVVTSLVDVPITLRGIARHNVANALGVAALAGSLGLEHRAIANGLARFRGTANENPGRLNLFDLGGATAVADFAHNPHGMNALVALAGTLPARRRLVLLGQAGDRDDLAIRDLARSAWGLRPDRIILKEMGDHLRGRAPGEIPRLLEEELLGLGAPADSISRAPSEFAAVLAALAWARRDDLLVLPVHSERERVLALLDRLEREGWVPGAPVPA